MPPGGLGAVFDHVGHHRRADDPARHAQDRRDEAGGEQNPVQQIAAVGRHDPVKPQHHRQRAEEDAEHRERERRALFADHCREPRGEDQRDRHRGEVANHQERDLVTGQLPEVDPEIGQHRAGDADRSIGEEGAEQQRKEAVVGERLFQFASGTGQVERRARRRLGKVGRAALRAEA